MRLTPDLNSRQFWQSAAISMAILLPVLLAVAVVWILNAPTGTDAAVTNPDTATNSDAAMKTRVEILQPFALIYGAMITFCTVVWRGIISTEDTRTAQRQLAATEQNNLALLLQNSAELLSQDDTRSINAGIATAQAIAADTNAKFAEPALGLLADHIQANSSGGHLLYDDEKRVSPAIHALNEVFAKTGRCAVRNLTFESPHYKKDAIEPEDVARDFSWYAVSGVTGWVRYFGGYFLEQTVNKPDTYCYNVYFSGGEVDFNFTMAGGCDFWQTRIRGNVASRAMESCRFRKCDFSGSTVDLNKIRDMLVKENFYYEDSAPEFIGNYSMEEISKYFAIKSPSRNSITEGPSQSG